LFEFKEDFQRTLLGYLWSLILNGWVEDAVFRQV
jgi:ABC-type polysaccharide/polyol phosphate export permease